MYPHPVLLRWSRLVRPLLALVAAVGSVLLVGGFLYSVTCGLRGCPGASEIQAFVPSEGGRVLDREGRLLGHLHPIRRINVPLEKIPVAVQQAFIAVEDRRFEQHHGVDWRGMLRAFWRNTSSLDVREGASTLTMQVVRSGFLPPSGPDRSLGRKLIELRLAPLLEDAVSKDRILEWYLNLIYLGDDTYGVEAASRHFFGKSVSRLSLAEAALLAGLPRAPSIYDPRRHPDHARERRDLVLDRMAREGFITPAEAREAKAQRIRVARSGWDPPAGATAAIEAVRPEVERILDGRWILGEVTVQTTFDRTAQLAAERAVRDRAAAIGRSVEGAMVALDPATGDVLAMVGGAGSARGGFNRAALAHRQPGSAFKPFVYAAALDRGLTPATLVDDEPVEVREPGTIWRPANAGGRYAGRITLRTALALSANAATVRVSQHVGVSRVADLAHRLGIASRLPVVPSLALGSAEVTPLELVTAYAPFANGGYRVTPTMLTRVTAGNRVLMERQSPEPRPVLDSVTAFLVTSMLQSVVDEGTASFLRELGVWTPVAGKTGTTNDGTDVWFVGYTPTILAGFWFGYDTPRPLGRGASGGRLAAPAWASFYRHGWQDHDDGEAWNPPEGVVAEEIDPETGLLAGDYCPTTRLEWFRAGTEPTRRCEIHDGWDDDFFRIQARMRNRFRDLVGWLRDHIERRSDE